MTLDSANEMLRQMWADIQRASRERALTNIKADPNKHRLTRILSEGANTGYVYWPAGQRSVGKRLEKTRFCVAKYKNAAGVFLIWRQVDKFKKVRGRWSWFQAERFDFQWSPTKKEAREIAARKAAKATVN